MTLLCNCTNVLIKFQTARLTPQSCRQKEVINIKNESAILIVAIITAAIAFAALILKIVEVSRDK